MPFLQVIRIEMNIGNQISNNDRLSERKEGTTMRFAYARMSTSDQNLERQLDQLTDCDEVFVEKISGTMASRPQLDRMISKLRPGDVVKVESFSRLGRSTKNLIELVDLFEKKGVKLVSLKENFDTTTPQGKLMMTVFQAFSQFERDLIVERTKEGLAAARARGRKGGRKPVNAKNLDKALKMYATKQFSISEIESTCGISRATLYKSVDLRDGKNISR
jgi:DNA invertase Pin-like site-specific DNA recombinase